MKNFIKFLTVFTVFLTISPLLSLGRVVDAARDATVGALNVAETTVEGATNVVEDVVAPGAHNGEGIARDRLVVKEPEIIEPITSNPSNPEYPNELEITESTLVVEPSITE